MSYMSNAMARKLTCELPTSRVFVTNFPFVCSESLHSRSQSILQMCDYDTRAAASHLREETREKRWHCAFNMKMYQACCAVLHCRHEDEDCRKGMQFWRVSEEVAGRL
jgi:hypothetical protein